jgi:hypothetical protein
VENFRASIRGATAAVAAQIAHGFAGSAIVRNEGVCYHFDGLLWRSDVASRQSRAIAFNVAATTAAAHLFATQ